MRFPIRSSKTSVRVKPASVQRLPKFNSRTGPFNFRKSIARCAKLWAAVPISPDAAPVVPLIKPAPPAGLSGLGSSDGPAGGNFGTVGLFASTLGGILRIRTRRGPTDCKFAETIFEGRKVALLLASDVDLVPFFARPNREWRNVRRTVILLAFSGRKIGIVGLGFAARK